MVLSKPITVIEPTSRMASDIGEIWENRDLIRLLVKRSFTVKYKQTLLGVLWAFVSPFVTTVVFNVVFGNIAKLSPQGAPSFLFFMSGNLVWSFFASCFSLNSHIFSSNAGLFGKVYFPRIIMPIVNCITSFVNFFIQFVFFLGFCLFFYLRDGGGFEMNPYALLFPILFLQMAMLAVGLGAIASSVTVKYRDLSMIFGFGVSLWMYITPVVYDHTQYVPQSVMNIYMLNPMTPVLNAFRYGFLGIGSPDIGYLLISMAVSIAVFTLGITVFDRAQRDFIDSV